MWALCWFLNHKWFPTVLTHAVFTKWGRFPEDDYYVLGKFKERVCLRCGHEEAVLVEKLATYDPFPGPYYDEKKATPGWYDMEPEHYPLPGDWGG